MSVLFKIELRVDCDEKKYLLAKHIIKQVALQAYARVALLDEGPKPEVVAYTYSDEGGHVDIPLAEFTRANDADLAAMKEHLREASSVVHPTEVGRPALRLVVGGRSASE
jgi:hypothetical protein